MIVVTAILAIAIMSIAYRKIVIPADRKAGIVGGSTPLRDARSEPIISKNFLA